MNIKHAQYMLTVMQEAASPQPQKALHFPAVLKPDDQAGGDQSRTPIFNRSTDPITLTYAGEKYIEAAKQILTINNNLQKEIDEINHEDHGCLKLGIPGPSAPCRYFPTCCPAFIEEVTPLWISICMNMVRPSRNLC